MHSGLHQDTDRTHEFIRVLHLEDDPADVELISHTLKGIGIPLEIRSVDTQEGFEECLRTDPWDIILGDFALRGFDGYQALELATQYCPAARFIFVTGTMGEDNAVESLKRGATDYVLKQNLVRLVPAVLRALEERNETLRRIEAEKKLHEKQEQLRFLAYHDPLTALPNRALLQERLTELLSGAQRHGERIAVLFVDLDRFKIINDSLGHAIGDQVLKAVGERLRNCSRDQDTVARLGGDEFVVVLTGIRDTSDAAVLADRINRIVSAEILAEGNRLNTTCSIGISVFPDDASLAETLISNADKALYSAKEMGRNTWQFFTPDMNRRARERLMLEHALRHALSRHEFFLEYQPKVDVASGTVTGAEALLRWRHPDLGLVPPDTFIPIAKNTGEIIRIGEWVLRTACAKVAQWRKGGWRSMTMAVNVSAVQLRHPSFFPILETILSETGLDPQSLELEIAERELAETFLAGPRIAGEAAQAGLSLAIDQFGAGSCGLAYLRQFPFTSLKIDQSFVKSAVEEPRERALTGAIIAMARALDMKVVAGCVETPEQVRLLQALGCDEMQGHYFGAPVSDSTFAREYLSAMAQ